jgi:hypothetical protein
MSNQNKWIVGGIVVVVAAIIVYAVYSNNKSSQTSQNSNQTTSTPATSPTTATSTPTTTPVSTTVPKNLSYGAAIKAYPERFQFSNQCEGTPATIAVRKGTPIMLDNRNNGEITIKADSDTFKLPGYNYAVFYPEIIENLAVTCDGKNSVTLNVEK